MIPLLFIAIFNIFGSDYLVNKIELAQGSFLLIDTVDVNKKQRKFLVSCGKVKNGLSPSKLNALKIDATPIQAGKDLTLRNYWRSNRFSYEFKCKQ